MTGLKRYTKIWIQNQQWWAILFCNIYELSQFQKFVGATFLLNACEQVQSRLGKTIFIVYVIIHYNLHCKTEQNMKFGSGYFY